MTNVREELFERFLRYAAVTSQSDAKAGKVPSTEGQRKLAELLADECRELGLADVQVSEFAVMTARLPSNLPVGAKAPKVGWCAHLDTVDAGLSPDIHPQVIRGYAGGDICLNAEKDLWLRTAEHPEVERYIGDDLLVSDGTSVLGADNKSAVANIMTALSIVIREGRPHGDIYVAFVPDEEIGLLGAKKLDISRFPVDFAYTIDSCELGEIVWQTFNAGGARLDIRGVTAHPMSAKGVLVNPILVAHDFIDMLDRSETPECTEGTEGFIWVNGITGGPAKCSVSLKIRDHNLAGYRAKKARIMAAAEMLREKHPRAGIELTMSDTYGNIADAIGPENRACIDLLHRAFEAEGVTPREIAMRGGTDGSYISTRGIPSPNYFTGAHNFHSSCEFMPFSSWEKSLAVTLRLIALTAAGD
ncbi:peptidase T [Sutterella sp.]|uniref:peptidase T n=1 Tax=Sutterella sp. TaxID=1981025 RepID=UPI0026DF71BF|nr:peptidase T [Sutterella sp.]MDO5531760.1 peptidase T [Sutterella sp.]